MLCGHWLAVRAWRKRNLFSLLWVWADKIQVSSCVSSGGGNAVRLFVIGFVIGFVMVFLPCLVAIFAGRR